MGGLIPGVRTVSSRGGLIRRHSSSPIGVNVLRPSVGDLGRVSLTYIMDTLHIAGATYVSVNNFILPVHNRYSLTMVWCWDLHIITQSCDLYSEILIGSKRTWWWPWMAETRCFDIDSQEYTSFYIIRVVFLTTLPPIQFTHTTGNTLLKAMHSGLNGNTVHTLTEPLLDQAYMHLLTCHISLSTKIHHNKLWNRLPVQLLAEYTNYILCP
jgi:hypothetical protein